jgi:hypothetical protein
VCHMLCRERERERRVSLGGGIIETEFGSLEGSQVVPTNVCKQDCLPLQLRPWRIVRLSAVFMWVIVVSSLRSFI